MGRDEDSERGSSRSTSRSRNVAFNRGDKEAILEAYEDDLPDFEDVEDVFKLRKV